MPPSRVGEAKRGSGCDAGIVVSFPFNFQFFNSLATVFADKIERGRK